MDDWRTKGLDLFPPNQPNGAGNELVAELDGQRQAGGPQGLRGEPGCGELLWLLIGRTQGDKRPLVRDASAPSAGGSGGRSTTGSVHAKRPSCWRLH